MNKEPFFLNVWCFKKRISLLQTKQSGEGTVHIIIKIPKMVQREFNLFVVRLIR